MRMCCKQAIACVFLGTLPLFSACNASSSPASHDDTEPTADTVPQTETAAAESQADTALSYLLTGGKEIRLIWDDCKQSIFSEQRLESSDITLADWNADGVEDVFIAASHNSPRGTYYRYDAALEQFVPWEAMQFEDGTGWLAQCHADGTFTIERYDPYGKVSTTYRWQQDAPVPMRCVEQYTNVVNYYDCNDAGNKVLAVREWLDPATGDCVRRVEHPFDFRVYADRIDVLQGEDVVQSLETTALWEAVQQLQAAHENGEVVFLEFGSQVLEPEAYLRIDDYDADGFDDLFVPDTLVGGVSGSYYRFDPKTNRFEMWEKDCG